MSSQLTKCRFGWAQVLQLIAHSLVGSKDGGEGRADNLYWYMYIDSKAFNLIKLRNLQNENKGRMK